MEGNQRVWHLDLPFYDKYIKLNNRFIDELKNVQGMK